MLIQTQYARPYAIAAFEYAQEHSALAEWSRMLQALTDIISQELIASVVENPEVDAEQLAAIVIQVAGDSISDPVKNFVKLLAKAHRLAVMPEISKLFEMFYAAINQTMDVEVTTSIELDDAFKEKLKAALHKRFDREPVLHCHIDDALIGGMVIRAGDEVIDGSIKGQLAKLKEYVAGEVCS